MLEGDYGLVCFASEILESVLTNGEKLDSSEILELIEKLFTQSCSGLIPDHATGHLSYISLIQDSLKKNLLYLFITLKIQKV